MDGRMTLWRHMTKFTKLTSVTLKMSQGDPYTIPNRFSMSRTCTYTPKFCDTSSFRVIAATLFNDEIDKVGVCDLESGSSRFSMRSTYTPNLVILAYLGKMSWTARQTDGWHYDSQYPSAKVWPRGKNWLEMTTMDNLIVEKHKAGLKKHN